jgi:universal stress protein A
MFERILVAVDLIEAPARQVLTKARAVARGEILVTHIVEPQQVQYSVDPTFTGSLTRALEEEAIATAGARLAEICEPFGIPADHQIVVMGRPADAIHELATDHAVDTIVVGSHVRAGIGLLLGSTANAILHNAPANVMVMKTGDHGDHKGDSQ